MCAEHFVLGGLWRQEGRDQKKDGPFLAEIKMNQSHEYNLRVGLVKILKPFLSFTVMLNCLFNMNMLTFAVKIYFH